MTQLDGKAVLETLKRTLSFYGTNPPPNEVSDQLGIPKEEADALWDEFLKAQLSSPSSPSPKPAEEAPVVAPKPVRAKRTKKAKPAPKVQDKKPAAPKKEPKKQAVHHVHNLPVETVKWLAGITALVIAFRMVGYLIEYFAAWESDPILAWTTAIALSLILFVSLQAAVLALKSKQVVMFITSFLLFATVAYVDMSGTASVIGKKKQAVVIEQRTESEDVLRARARADQLDKDIKGLESSIVQLSTERTQLLTEQAGLDKADEKYDVKYNSMRTRLNTNKAAIDTNTINKDNKAKELQSLQETPGFYSVAVAKASDGEASTLDWAVAIGLGLVGPWALTVTLFLRGKDEDDPRDQTKGLPVPQGNRDSVSTGDKRTGWFFGFRKKRSAPGTDVDGEQ